MLASRIFFFSFFCFFSLCLSNSPYSDISTLLSFKASVTGSSDSLSSWVNSTDPCFDSWGGVTCNPSTHRVIKLVLEDLDLTGAAEVLSRLTELRLLSLKNNLLSSSNLNLSSWPHLKHLYLSHNRFTGTFPSGVSSLRHLRRVDLSHNAFEGEIPMAELTRLPYLLTLRLEDNRFTGTLYSLNSSSQSILDFNVSNNQLSGQIPAWMSRFGGSSFARNKNLCGRPLPSDCSNRTVEPEQPPRSRTRSSRVVTVIVIVIFDAVAILVAVVTVTWCCYRRKRRSLRNGGGGVHKEVVKKRGNRKGDYGGARDGGDVEEMVMFEGCNKGFRNVGDLLKSSAELLGKGCVGPTYKVVLDGGDVVAVKRIRERKKKREVDEWLGVIGGLRHSNIVSIRAYCNGKDELFLVYDYLPHGSLHSLLHGSRGPGRMPVDWNKRLKLASDSAKGLAFLHGYNKVHLFHGHLSSSNIVVDQSGNACISDIGVHQLFHTPFFINDAYNAPELKFNNNNNYSQRKFWQRCDVYSFGVVLLEILTGKMAKGDGELGIVKWVQMMGQDESAWEVFDFELIMDKEMEEEMRALLQVALLCLAPLPKDRPNMSIVHRMIEDIRTKGSIDGCANSIMNNISSDSSPSQSENTYNFTNS
ncbi:hypothetical protein WN944_000586 [Citrus x changshan-huyou]|uniref:Protein kinase domain-containing protein n=1 Tax=Citrus x changshan-huyou TaxID=2935761 RepID=A0AAP0MHN2_9ROSI